MLRKQLLQTQQQQQQLQQQQLLQLHQQMQQQQLQTLSQPISPSSSLQLNNHEEQVMQASDYNEAIHQQQCQALHLKHLAQINAQLQQQVTVCVSCCCKIIVFILSSG